MTVIDADCHVIECEDTWQFFDEAEAKHAPLYLTGQMGDATSPSTADFATGPVRTRPRATSLESKRPEKMAGFSRTTEAMRTMRDIPGRLRHMDELGVDVQVLYPTTMALGQVSPRPEVDVAMSRSYNRWLAQSYDESKGRLRWIAVPGVLNMDEALKQVRWSVDHGACGVMLRGFEGNRLVTDPYFFPLYEEAQGLGVPICIHAGQANPTYASMIAGFAWSNAKVPVISAFHHLLYNEIPTKFPRLRFGFIEVAAGWVPYMLTDLRRRMIRDGRTPFGDHPLADNRMYIACQTNDDLEYIVQQVGEDNLVIGSDYGHSDTSSELEALKTLQQETELPARVVQKILSDNPAALYGI